MTRQVLWITFLGWFVSLPLIVLGDDAARVLSVEALTQQARSSLVTISVNGRDGGQLGLGTGFVVSQEGLIATNLHVIGEGYGFTVELADGTDLEVKSVHASDHGFDLVIIRVDPKGKQLSPLPLGDSEGIQQGAPVVVLGNPLGLKHSVVSGVVSARREINGRSMLQLAMPIEPGNSGGPVLDMQGNVVGLVNMKSAVNENLGFAVEVNSLKPLLEHPNPIPIARWTTIGGMDARRWQPLFGALWRQRAGRILVKGSGSGFGGRSLCLYQLPTPQPPFELAVQVRLNNESGAAGLVFHADGGDKHYGFYPSNGQLRLTCFNGATVYQWQVLDERSSSYYRPGEWNQLKVRVENQKLSCFVNDRLVMESSDATFAAGKVGLAKFRDTEAEFKQFQVAKEVAMTIPATAQFKDEIDKLSDFASLPPERIAAWAEAGDAVVASLRQRAKEFELRAVELQRLARDVHVAKISGELASLVQNRDNGFDLLRAGLLIAKLDEEDIDLDGYIQEVDRMAADVSASLAGNADEPAKLQALNDYLFRQNGFHGARFEYYHRANSYLNRVIDDRAGLPITLSVLYMELGRRLGLTIEGVGLPSHFAVRFKPSQGESQLIDVFDQGKPLTRDDAERIVRANGLPELRDEHLRAQHNREILARMLANLWGTAERSRDVEALWRYAEAAIALDPESVQAHLNRAILRGETGRVTASLADCDWIIDRQPPGVDLQRVRALRERFEQRLH